MIVVTGATGHLGAALVRELVGNGESVRVIARATSDTRGLEGLPIEILRTELFEAAELARAFDGADVVYHAAARISIGRGDWASLYRSNVEGTRAVLAAARAASVPRFLYVSSIEALPLAQARGPVTEAMGLAQEDAVMQYGRSKALATRAVLDAAGEGYDAVVVFPTAIVGPYDFRLSPMGRMIYDYCRLSLPAYVDGGFDFVDVRDVARGIALAAKRGRRGEGYILSGEYIGIPDLMAMLERTTRIPKPRLRLPMGFIKPLVPLVEAYYRILRKPPRFTRSSLDILSCKTHVDSSKARRELGYAARPLAETIRDTVAWFEERGLVAHRIKG